MGDQVTTMRTTRTLSAVVVITLCAWVGTVASSEDGVSMLEEETRHGGFLDRLTDDLDLHSDVSLMESKDIKMPKGTGAKVSKILKPKARKVKVAAATPKPKVSPAFEKQKAEAFRRAALAKLALSNAVKAALSSKAAAPA